MTSEISPEHDDSTVRYYCADGVLTVTRDDETNEHVIKSRGHNRGDKWTRRVPATRTTVDVSEVLWSIPDNWTRVYKLTAEYGHDDGIYRIPESGDAVLVSLCHKTSYITDANHTVEAVGSIVWDARAAVDEETLNDAISYVNDYADEFPDDVREVLQYIRDNPREAVADAEKDAEMYAVECVEDWDVIPASEFDAFRVTFRSEGGIVSHPEYPSDSEVMELVRELLSEFHIVPPSPLVSVTVR